VLGLQMGVFLVIKEAFPFFSRAQAYRFSFGTRVSVAEVGKTGSFPGGAFLFPSPFP